MRCALNYPNLTICRTNKTQALRVYRQNVLGALLWLKKHNPLYSNISIGESNLYWMQGEEEVSIATNAEKFQIKNSKHIQIISSEPEHVSPSAQQDTPDSDNIAISTMHTNQPNPLPSGDNANIIQSFKSIAQTTGQVAQVMNFPPIDNDSLIKYVFGYFLKFNTFQNITLTFASNSEYDITENIFIHGYFSKHKLSISHTARTHCHDY